MKQYKGNDTDKGDVSVTYKHAIATLTGEVDVLNFSKASASISAGHGRFSAGASADLGIAKAAVTSTNFVLGAGFTIPGSLFAGLRASKNLSEYITIVTYVVAPNVTMAGNVAFKTKDNSVSGVLATIYKCNDSTVLKLKTSSIGTVNASVKQTIGKKFTVIGSTEIPRTFTGIKFGVNATLG